MQKQFKLSLLFIFLSLIFQTNFDSIAYGRSVAKATKKQIENPVDIKTQNLRKILLAGVEQLSVPNYAGGHGLCACFINTSDKQIKYVYIHVKFKNEVGDDMHCSIRNHYGGQLRLTGPISPNECKGAFWDNVIYNHQVARTTQIESLKIEYIDGTSYTFKKEDIPYIRFTNPLLFTFDGPFPPRRYKEINFLMK